MWKSASSYKNLPGIKYTGFILTIPLAKYTIVVVKEIHKGCCIFQSSAAIASEPFWTGFWTEPAALGMSILCWRDTDDKYWWKWKTRVFIAPVWRWFCSQDGNSRKSESKNGSVTIKTPVFCLLPCNPSMKMEVVQHCQQSFTWVPNTHKPSNFKMVMCRVIVLLMQVCGTDFVTWDFRRLWLLELFTSSQS